ncbi:hypothetical protein R6Y99_21860 [Pseudomonas lundensis]|uniref:hypothetical protein n=1 Tax=Serratia proteamaculans TaxID=28151 RepID=UPI002981E9A9|nr:hypothetical protein [Serratia proteamaculans]MDW5502447.1 hypothetical protein [Serratia proteamaculans]MDW5507503.1 hypothetical protein [Pseudomonas lundensis]
MTKTLTTEAMQEIYEAAVHLEAVGDDPDAEFDLYCKLDDVGGVEATIRKLIDMVRAANREAQPVASREHFESLCNQFWNWTEFDEINTEEEPRLKWDGKKYSHRVTAALWRMYQAAPPAPAVPEALANDIDSDDHPLLWSHNNGWNACRAAMLAQPQIEPQNIPNNIPDGLAAAVNRLLDSDGSRGCFSAVRSYDAREEIERLLAQPVSQCYKLDGLNIRAVAALREAVRNQWLKSNEFAEKVYWHNMHSIANEIIEAMAAAPEGGNDE